MINGDDDDHASTADRAESSPVNGIITNMYFL